MAGAALAAFALSSCATTPVSTHYRDAVDAFNAANFRGAYRASQRALEESPDDPKIQRFAERMRAAILLDEARKRIFEGREREGLKLLARVLSYHPDNATARLWQRKAQDQLATRRLTSGMEAVADDAPERALEAFQEVLALQPGNEAALRGIKDVQAIFAERGASASGHYRDAMRARQVPDWERALYHASATTDRDPTHERARRIERSARQQVASKRERWAEQLANEGRWGAAGRELNAVASMIRELDAERAAKLGLRAKVYLDEAEAQEHYSNAEFRIAAKDFDGARTELARASELSTLDRVVLNELQGALRVAERDTRYAEARFLELSYQIEKALSLYSELAISDPDGLAKDKVESLEQLMRDVRESFEKGKAAEEAGELDAAIDAYRRVLALHPLYADCPARLARVTAAKKAAAGGDAGDGDPR